MLLPFRPVTSPEALDPVVIIGAGPTGLMAALILTELNVPVEIYDINIEPTTTWRAPGFNARTMELFARYGLAERFRAVSNPRNEISIYADGKRVAHLELYGARTEFPHLFLCPQSETERVLRERLAELDVHVRWGWEFLSYQVLDRAAGTDASSIGPNEAVTVRLRQRGGAPHAPQTITRRAAYLFGCDGAHSRVRKTMGAAFDGRRIDVKIAAGDVLADIDWPNAGRFTLHTDGIVGAVRIPGQDSYRVFLTWGDQEPADLTPEVYAEVMQRRIAPERIPNLRVLSCTLFTLQERRASYFSAEGRVFLCGDAAHVHSPAGAQGLNLGVQDAENLAWKLALVYHGSARAELLDTYSVERIPLADSVIATTHKLFSKTMAGGSVLRTIMLKHTAPFLASAPRKLQRKHFEQNAQLRVRYESGKANLAVSQHGDHRRWENAGWSALLTDDLCVPGARALDGLVADLTIRLPGQQTLRLREWYYMHRGAHNALAFLDCSAIDRCDGHSSGASGIRRRIRSRASSKHSASSHHDDCQVSVHSSSSGGSYDLIDRIDRVIIEELLILAAVLRAYRPRMPLGIVLHGARSEEQRDSIVRQLVEYFPSAVADIPLAEEEEWERDSTSPLVRIFGDLPQGKVFDDLSLAGLYMCEHSGTHAVYLVRPDGYVACRGSLKDSGAQIQDHLNRFMYEA